MSIVRVRREPAQLIYIRARNTVDYRVLGCSRNQAFVVYADLRHICRGRGMILKAGKAHETQIDDEEYEKVGHINWWIQKSSISLKPYVWHPDHGMLSRMIMDTPDGMDCDHINGDTLDNRKANLRNCTKSQNLVNQPKYLGKSSKYKGVSWYPNRKYGELGCSYEGKTILLGYFEDEWEAALAYNKKAFELSGEMPS